MERVSEQAVKWQVKSSVYGGLPSGGGRQNSIISSHKGMGLELTDGIGNSWKVSAQYSAAHENPSVKLLGNKQNQNKRMSSGTNTWVISIF